VIFELHHCVQDVVLVGRLFPHLVKVGYEYRSRLATGESQLIGTLIDRRRPQCGAGVLDASVFLPADSVARRNARYAPPRQKGARVGGRRKDNPPV
jgi:hypothetical protein